MREPTKQLQEVKQELLAAGVPVWEDEPLSRHTTFQIGGPATLFTRPRNEEELCKALQAAQRQGIRRYLLGKGSNILFKDEGFDGLVIALGEGLDEVSVQGNMLTAGAGASLAQICLAAQRAGLSGLEFAYGIPGSVGGAVYMNAGAYGGEMKDTVQKVHCLDLEGKQHILEAKQLAFGYRTSCFEKSGWCVTRAVFALRPGHAEEIRAAMSDYLGRRKEKQPLEKPSAGSAFKRPQGAYASALIDQCGLKGYQVGGAAISEKHAGFIVNLGGATCADVLAVADQVASIVKEKTGFILEKEIRVVG